MTRDGKPAGDKVWMPIEFDGDEPEQIVLDYEWRSLFVDGVWMLCHREGHRYWPILPMADTFSTAVCAIAFRAGELAAERDRLDREVSRLMALLPS